MELRRARKATGMTQQEAAAAVGVTERTIRNLEAAECGKSVRVLLRLFLVYGYDGQMAPRTTDPALEEALKGIPDGSWDG